MPARISARGIERRASWISPAMIGASSSPANAKHICEKKITVSSLPNEGANDDAGIGVAEPDASSAITPTASSTTAGSHCAMPPRFCSQRPLFMPMMLSHSATASSTSEAPAVYVALFSSATNRRLKMYSANTTVDNVSVGKYRMLDDQYSQPAMKPWRSPKASPIQTYKPPSFGIADDSVITHSPCGMKNATAASTHSTSEDGPLCAVSATQRRPTIATTLNSTRSKVRRVFWSAMTCFPCGGIGGRDAGA